MWFGGRFVGVWISGMAADNAIHTRTIKAARLPDTIKPTFARHHIVRRKSGRAPAVHIRNAAAGPSHPKLAYMRAMNAAPAAIQVQRARCLQA
jgi:hypothetical protein